MQKLVIPRGTTFSFILKLKDAQGNPYQLSEGDSLYFGIKHFVEHKNYLVYKTKNLEDYSEALGGYRFIINPEDTINFVFDDYVYDIGCQKFTGEFYQIIPASTLTIDKTITKKVAPESEQEENEDIE